MREGPEGVRKSLGEGARPAHLWSGENPSRRYSTRVKGSGWRCHDGTLKSMKKTVAALVLSLSVTLLGAPQAAVAAPQDGLSTMLGATNTSRYEYGLVALENDPVLALLATTAARDYAAADRRGEAFRVDKASAPQGYSLLESFTSKTTSMELTGIMWGMDADLRAVATSSSVNATGVGEYVDEEGTHWIVQVFSQKGEPNAAPRLVVKKAQGVDRYHTSVALAKQEFPNSKTVVLASGTRLVDAASAAPLAAQLSAPVLLAPTLDPGDYPGLDKYPEFAPVLTYLVRERVERVVLVGGEASLGKGYEDALEGKGITVERVAGSDRYETSLAVAQRPELSGAKHVLLSTGDLNFMADAVSAGGVAASLRSPVLLVQPGGPVDPRLAGLEAVALGGKLEQSVVDAYGARRLAGADRYETSRQVAQWAVAEGVPSAEVNVAAGGALPDALVAGATGRIALLVPEHGWDAASKAWLSASATTTVLAVGGRTATS